MEGRFWRLRLASGISGSGLASGSRATCGAIRGVIRGEFLVPFFALGGDAGVFFRTVVSFLAGAEDGHDFLVVALNLRHEFFLEFFLGLFDLCARDGADGEICLANATCELRFYFGRVFADEFSQDPDVSLLVRHDGVVFAAGAAKIAGYVNLGLGEECDICAFKADAGLAALGCHLEFVGDFEADFAAAEAADYCVAVIAAAVHFSEIFGGFCADEFCAGCGCFDG